MYDVAAHTTPLTTLFAPHFAGFRVVHRDDIATARTELTAAHPGAHITVTPDDDAADDLILCGGCPATVAEDDADAEGWALDEARGEWHCASCADAGPTPGPYDRAYWG